MNGASKHIIKEAVLDFHYNGNADGFAFQQEIKLWVDKFYPVLEQMLNRLPEKDEVISIDKVEIEVKLNVSEWKEQAGEKIGRQLQKKLDLLSKEAAYSKGFQKKRQDQQFGDLFLFYLRNGYLSWEISDISSSQWDEALRSLITVADTEYVTELKDTLRTSSSAAQRFAQIIPFQSSVHLFSLLREGNLTVGHPLLPDLELLMEYAEKNRLNDLKQMGYRVFLQSVVAEADWSEVKDEVGTSFKRKILADPHLIEAIMSFDFQSELFRRMQAEVEDTVRNKMKSQRIPETALPGPDRIRERPADERMITEEVYISDAGLVLIAAFIPAFFEKTSLSGNDQITDFNKAVCMIRFFATGSERVYEYELPLAKILCGLDLKTAIDAENFRPAATAKVEAEAVLSSVIEYWSIVRNTSVAGLRESFLRRNGRLRYDGKNWLLQVEQRPYDMLIQHLPWNFSMIKLPWMNCWLKTEWVY